MEHEDITKSRKARQIMKLNPQIESVAHMQVSAKWYRYNVDYRLCKDEAVGIVQFTYKPELYAYPHYMLDTEYSYNSASYIANQTKI